MLDLLDDLGPTWSGICCDTFIWSHPGMVPDYLNITVKPPIVPAAGCKYDRREGRPRTHNLDCEEHWSNSKELSNGLTILPGHPKHDLIPSQDPSTINITLQHRSENRNGDATSRVCYIMRAEEAETLKRHIKRNEFAIELESTMAL